MGDLLLGSSPVENDPNRLGQQCRRSKVRLVCKRRAVGLGASTNGTNTFVLMDAPLLNRIAVRGKMSPFGVPVVMWIVGGRAARLEAEMQPRRRLADLLVLGIL